MDNKYIDIDQKENLDKIRSLFFGAKNHNDFYQTCKSFETDLERGTKLFAVSSIGREGTTQNTILGISSYFIKRYNMKIAILSNREISDSLFIEKKAHGNLKYNLKRFCYNLEFISPTDLMKNCELKDVESLLNHIIAQYDLLFLDIPNLYNLKKEFNVYFPLLVKFENISIIVSESISYIKDVRKLSHFLGSYDLRVKGVIFDSIF